MTSSPRKTQKRRAPLSRERVLQAALALADEAGEAGLTMRNLGRKLGVEAMSLYEHVANKEDLVDGLIELVFSEIEVPSPGEIDWKSAMRRRAISVREALNRHPWAIGLMEGRINPGPATIHAHNALIGGLREGGFSARNAIHASSVMDAYIYGFALQERGLPFDAPEEAAEVMQEQSDNVGGLDDFPYLAEIATELAKEGYDYAAEFELGLELILAALEPLRSPIGENRTGSSRTEQP